MATRAKQRESAGNGEATDKSPTAVDEAKERAAAQGEPKPGQRAEISNLDIVRFYFDRRRRAPRAPRRRPHRLLDPLPRGHRPDPRQALRRQDPHLLRLPDPAQRRPRPLQGRHPLPPRSRHRRGPRPRLADDLEDRRRERAVRRRQGRRQLPRRPARALRGAEDHPLLHGQDREGPRSDTRHPGPGRQHQRPGDGLDDGRVRQAPRPHARRSAPASRSPSRAHTAASRRPDAAASTCSARPRRRSG